MELTRAEIVGSITQFFLENMDAMDDFSMGVTFSGHKKIPVLKNAPSGQFRISGGSLFTREHDSGLRKINIKTKKGHIVHKCDGYNRWEVADDYSCAYVASGGDDSIITRVDLKTEESLVVYYGDYSRWAVSGKDLCVVLESKKKDTEEFFLVDPRTKEKKLVGNLSNAEFGHPHDSEKVVAGQYLYVCRTTWEDGATTQVFRMRLTAKTSKPSLLFEAKGNFDNLRVSNGQLYFYCNKVMYRINPETGDKIPVYFPADDSRNESEVVISGNDLYVRAKDKQYKDTIFQICPITNDLFVVALEERKKREEEAKKSR